MRELGLDFGDMAAAAGGGGDKGGEKGGSGGEKGDGGDKGNGKGGKAKGGAGKAVPKGGTGKGGSADQRAAKPAIVEAAGGGGGNGGGDAFAATAGEVDWERFQGPEQLKMPATFALEALKEAGLPGCASWGSARALASFYAALGSGKLVSAATLRAAATRGSHSGSLDGESVGWGLGLQVGSATNASGQRAAVLGHRGTGGVLGLCVPAADLAVAVTVSRLSSERAVTRRLLELVMKECGKWRLSEDGDDGGLL
jgi:CubicO group peptidase (beta-lactamase class C family)